MLSLTRQGISFSFSGDPVSRRTACSDRQEVALLRCGTNAVAPGESQRRKTVSGLSGLCVCHFFLPQNVDL